MSPQQPLACPSCGLGHPAEERFCTNCRMPLVVAAADGGPGSGSGIVGGVLAAALGVLAAAVGGVGLARSRRASRALGVRPGA